MSLTGRFPGLKKDEIEQDVRAELTAEQRSTDHFLVRVVVDRGVVHLSGSADSYARKWAIERAVGRVVGVAPIPSTAPPPDEGVTRINNELLVA